MKFTYRGIHRDFAYFYIGLIIAFSFSGIVLNHRRDWYPMDYTYEQKEVAVSIPDEWSDIDEETLIRWSDDWAVEYESHRLNEESLRIYFKDNAILDMDLNTGKGSIEFRKKVPILGHTMFLHKTTDKAWIWYSDIFGIAMLTIAITGMFIPLGPNGFKSRGWKLAVAGVIFPLLFLIFLA